MSRMPPFNIHPSLLAIMDQYYDVERDDKEPLHLQPFGQKNKGEQSKPMKILYVTFFQYPNTGGLSHYIHSIKKGFEKAGHIVDVLAPNHMPSEQLEEWIPEADSEARKFMKERYGAVNEKIVKNLSYLHVFEWFLKDKNLEQYDILHAQDLFALFILGHLNQTYQKPLLFTPHGFFTKSRLKFNKMKKGSMEEAYFTELEKVGMEASTEIVIISDSFRPDLIDFGAADEKMTTVHTGIDFTPLPHENHGNIVLTCVSRLSPRKGHRFLLEALAKLREHLTNVEVWIVGDGVMKEKLMEQAKELELNNVTFFGKRHDIPYILSMSDIYVLATVNDNFPLSVLEAMFSGQAVISTTCGGIPEMIRHEETGILCEPGNVDQLAHAIKRFLTNKEERVRFAKAAESYARQHFTSEVMTRKIEQIYQKYL
ncbi:Glycosyltransferase involved in cell wall bisynthesis [Halobacillus dabanensis]|uniref:Glycosyltransferase involved in cell wall bisynthesis n=1 Tax=Halobacillus dabanensis TaxID=240302 RepID=A0A1I3W8W5_HALDA|nr:glycosyltransferase family 4 protein [Halobacillus dabanensis]SFK03117.1 Glycosyltransferase involved in cell wall bisynthesis [Halobacillus dabanensis]